MKLLRNLIVCLSGMLAFGVHATERELGSDGDRMHLGLNAEFRCQKTVPITIRTKSAAYFDQDAAKIQSIVVNTAGAILGFECQSADKIEFFGYTDDVLVFRADAEKHSKWAMQSYPAPLETLALFFGLHEPAFEHLGTISEELRKYESVPGIKETNQYKSFQTQALRLVEIADGDTKTFITYLENPGHEFKTFEAAKAHYGNILSTIEAFAPNQYEAYKNAYDDVEGSLKDTFWSSRVTSIIDDHETMAEIVAAAVNSVKESGSEEYHVYVDERIADWIEEDADLITEDIPTAPLYELGFVSDYVATFPAPTDADSLPKTKAVLDKVPGRILPLTLERLVALQTLALETVQESGASYVDVDTILETGFALAEEFEEAGYVEDGETLLAATFAYVNEMLESNLESYREELSTMEFTAESVAALQEQVLLFEELSADIASFKSYQDTAEKTLADNKATICRNVSNEAGIGPDTFDRLIKTPEGTMPLIDLACRLFEHQHRISAFEPADNDETYTLEVIHENEEKHRFLLKSQGAGVTAALMGVKQLAPEEMDITQEFWQDYIANLLEPPPSGEPDPQGVRECDRLAADPHDANKLASGVDFESEDIDPNKFERALDACIAAVEDASDDTRQQYQLGRLLWYAGDQESAEEFINTAADSGYAPALYYKAEILLGTSDDPDAFIDALDLYEKAGNAGYERGNAMVKELNPEGLDFFKEITPPTPKEIISALKVQNLSQSILGVTSTATVIDIKVKDCFQTSATDFSCEYRKILKCGMSGWGNDPVIRMMSWAIQKDCDSTQYNFGSFRKVGEGKWEELPNQS